MCIRDRCIAGLWFGGFQAGMPLLGYFLGRFFSDVITEWDHWIACILLVLIGGNMVKEAFGEEEHLDCSMCAKTMFPLAVATSIDAPVSYTHLIIVGGIAVITIVYFFIMFFILMHRGRQFRICFTEFYKLELNKIAARWPARCV